jgi:hypothetical protein
MKTILAVITTLMLSLAASAAFACSGNPPPNCSCDATTNTWVTTTVSLTNTNVNNNVNNSQNNSVNNSVNKSTNVNGVNGNVGSTSSATGGNSSSSASIAAGAATANASGAGANSGDNSNDTNIDTTYRAAKIPVNTAYSAGLTSGLDTCLGSASAGLQTVPVGITFGKTTNDQNCILVKRTHLVTEFSRQAGCQYMLDQFPDIAASFAKAGATCEPPPPVVVIQPAPVVANDYVTRAELLEIENRILTKLSRK